MTDKTQSEAMTAERMEEIRERARLCSRYDAPATSNIVLAREDVPALLSALEEARGEVGALEILRAAAHEGRREAEARRDDALASLAKMAEHRDALAKELDEERFERFRREKNTGKALAEVAASRDALAARVAELEGALARLAQKIGPHRPEWPQTKGLGDCLTHGDLGDLLELLGRPPAAPPEKAPALPWPVTASAMHACSLSFPDVESNSMDNVCGAFTIAECLADTLETVTCLACLREIARQRAPKSAPVMVHCPPRVAERAAAPADADPCRSCGAPWVDHLLKEPHPCRKTGCAAFVSGGNWCLCDVACPPGEYDPRCQHPKHQKTTPAADPLCARDFGGGLKCGHPLSVHPEWAGRRCMRIACYCPGFVPEPRAVRDAARSVLKEIGAALDAADARPSALSGVGDGGTAARKHWPDCALNHGGSECDMGPDCGSNTEEGETR